MKKTIMAVLMMLITLLTCSVIADERIQLHHINTKGYAVRVVYRDMNGIIWFGTTSGLLSLPQLESHNPSGYHRNLGNVNMSIKRINGDSQWELLNEGHYRYLGIDPDGYLWLIGNEGSEGLTLLTPDGLPVDLPEELKTAPMKSLSIDADGTVWANDLNGLYLE